MNALTHGRRHFAASRERIQAHWSYLCSEIGERRAGSRGDRKAADYVLETFRASGLSAVHGEDFPCVSVVEARVELAIGRGKKLASVPARVLAGSPGTPRGRTVDSELVWVEMPEQAERFLQPSLRGKIVVLVGPMPTRAAWHEGLVKARPAAVIHVDDRLPFEWVKDDGVYPAWARRYGMPPTVTIPFRTAWDLRCQGANRARARISVKLQEATSQNLVGDILGRRPNLPVVLLGAHHDTQCNNTGADDNASGVVALLELAHRLGGKRFDRTIRLVSFGAEEQLSVGSACYVSAHRSELTKLGVVLNLDSVSSPLGHHWLIRAGSNHFGEWLVERLGRAGLDVAEKTGTMPFADHFPFSAFGIPSVTFLRPNMDGGMRWQHHSAHDNLANVSADELIRVIDAVAQVTVELAQAPRWPFPRGLDKSQQAETARMAKELFGFKARLTGARAPSPA
jgi:hypothetical protein